MKSSILLIPSPIRAAIIILTLCQLILPAMPGQASAQSITPSSLKEAIPSPAYYLFQWPNNSVLNGPCRIDPLTIKNSPPLTMPDAWIKKVLAKSWWPPASSKPIYLHGEFQERDVVRMAWEKDACRIEVSQTATVMAIKISKLDGSAWGNTANEKIETAKKLCSEIFNETEQRRTGQLELVPVPGLPEKIISFSFNPDSIHVLPEDNAIWGRHQSMTEENLKPRTQEENEQDDRPGNINWYLGAASWKWWFRNIDWWNDGKSVGYYFFKSEADQWIPSGDNKIDRTWFFDKEK